MDSKSIEDILAELRAWGLRCYPGHHPRAFTLEYDDGQTMRLLIPPADESAASYRHSPDFRSVSSDAVSYIFSPLQATVVKTLWEARERGAPDVGQETLLEAAGSDSNRLRDVFKNHPAWGALIVSAGRGTFRLVLDDSS